MGTYTLQVAVTKAAPLGRDIAVGWLFTYCKIDYGITYCRDYLFVLEAFSIIHWSSEYKAAVAKAALIALWSCCSSMTSLS